MRAARYLGTLSSTFNYQFNDLFLCFYSTKIGNVKSKPEASGAAKCSRMVKSECCNARSLFVFRCLSCRFFRTAQFNLVDSFLSGRSQYQLTRPFGIALAIPPLDVTLHLNWWSNRCRLPMGEGERHARLALVNVDANDFGDCSKRQQKRTKSKTSEKLWRTWPTSWTTDTTLQLRNIIYAVYFLMPFRVFFFASFNRAAQHRRMLRRAFTFQFRLFFQRVFPTLRGCRDGTRSFQSASDWWASSIWEKRNQIELVVFEGRIVSRGVYEGCVTACKLLSWIFAFIGSLKARSNCEESDFRSLKLGCVLDLRNGSLVSFLLFCFQCTSRCLIGVYFGEQIMWNLIKGNSR